MRHRFARPRGSSDHSGSSRGSRRSGIGAAIRRRAWPLWFGGFCFLVLSLVVGSLRLAGAAPSNATVCVSNGGATCANPVVVAGTTSGGAVPVKLDQTGTNNTVSQGSAGTSAWKVDGTGGTFPVTGSVQVAGRTVAIAKGSNVPLSMSEPPIDIGHGSSYEIGNTGVLNVSSFRDVKLTIWCYDQTNPNSDVSQCSRGEVTVNNQDDPGYNIEYFNLPIDGTTSKTYEMPGTAMAISVNSGPTFDSLFIWYVLVGRTD